MQEGAKKEVTSSGSEAKEMKKSATDGLSEFETANSRSYPKIFSLIIAKNFKAKSSWKTINAGGRLFLSHTLFFPYKHTLTFLFLKRLWCKV